jgi:phage shock protein E
MEIENIIKEHLVTIIDVRSHTEFRGGSLVDAINIPIEEFPLRLEEIKKMKAPLILCCASGMRSSQAQHYLSNHKIECYNGGSWLNINYLKSKSNQ